MLKLKHGKNVDILKKIFYKLYYKSTIVMHFLGPYTFYFCQIMFNKIVKFCFQLKKM